MILIIRRREWKQCHTARPLDGRREQSLMAGAIARNPAWCHLAALGNELREGLNVFVIDS